jgi:GR25 family glycosyltransferase involved in LPS biosynthesis
MPIKNNIQYYCTHHDLAIDRKEYIYTNIVKPYDIDICWIEKYRPDSTFIKNHPIVHNIHAANRQYLNASELSCYYKHYLAIRNIAESKTDGIILEDDIESPRFDFKNVISDLHELMIIQECDILFVGSFDKYDLNYQYPSILMNQLTKSRCSHCYIVRSNIAHKLANYLFSPSMPLDWQLNYAITDLELKSGWSWPHVYQRTEKNMLPSLIR